MNNSPVGKQNTNKIAGNLTAGPLWFPFSEGGSRSGGTSGCWLQAEFAGGPGKNNNGPFAYQPGELLQGMASAHSTRC